MDSGAEWWGYDLSKPATYSKCIKNLVKQCRTTFEYNIWQKMTKSGCGDTCPICNVEYIYSRPESHHYPRTLYEVVEAVMQEYIHSNSIDDITPLELIKEIMDLHLANQVDNIVLCKHCHAKYHDMDPETMKQVEQLYQLTKEQKCQVDQKAKEIDLKEKSQSS